MLSVAASRRHVQHACGDIDTDADHKLTDDFDISVSVSVFGVSVAVEN